MGKTIDLSDLVICQFSWVWIPLWCTPLGEARVRTYNVGNYTRHNITIITDNTIFIVCDVLWCSTEDNVTYSLLHYLLCSFFFFRLHFNDLVYLRPINHCHFLTFKVLTMGNLHKDVFSTFQKLQNLESFDELLINQIMMKMTPKLRWTFPAPVDRIWPSPVCVMVSILWEFSVYHQLFSGNTKTKKKYWQWSCDGCG